MMASMTIQGSRTTDCGVRFLSPTLKMGTHTVTDTLNEFRKVGLVGFIPIKVERHKRYIELIHNG